MIELPAERKTMSVAAPARKPITAKGPAVMRALPNVAREWGIRGQDMAQMLGVPDSTYRRWKGQPERANLDLNQMERASYLLGIYKALRILLPDQDAIHHWLHSPNTNAVFQGQAPIDRLGAGQMADLMVVRQYLDAARGW
jgi:hypothetical protein